jgi:cobyrinic acid a,c-diamide synthase
MTAANAPRLLLSAPSSGSGKTTAAIAVLSAFRQMGLKASAFKSGPDYIDPMFHEEALGAKSRNLDLYMLPEGAVLSLAARNSQGSDVSVIEGAMGYYDGLSVDSDFASSAHLARVLAAPTVLVLDCRGMGASALALLSGFQNFAPNTIKGAILNNASLSHAKALSSAIEERLGIKAYGALPRMPGCALKSRHLGLVTAQEVEGILSIVEKLGQAAREYIDMDGLLRLAESAPPLSVERGQAPSPMGRALVAVARDRAFCFYYQDSLELLESLGCEIAYFSPLKDEKLPEGADAAYLGGGYPELCLEELSSNRPMLESIRSAVESGMPLFAECGGYMYLHESIKGEGGKAWPMAGLVPGSCEKANALVRFGYCEMRADIDNSISRAGDAIKAHEFHYYESSFEAQGKGFAFRQSKGGREWKSGYAYKGLVAGFPHIHFHSNPAFARRFASQAIKRRKESAMRASL